MPLSFIALLIVVGLAGLAVGVRVTRRSRVTPPVEPPRIVVVPEALADLALRLAAATTLDTLLNDVVGWLSSHYSLPLAIAYRYDPATNELVDPVYAGTLSSIPEPLQRIRPGVTMYGEVARERMACYVPDISKESRFGASAEGMRCAYLMPLHREAVLIGVLCLQSSDQQAFDEAQQLIFDRIASLIGHLAMPVVRLGYSEQAIQRFDRFQLVAQRLAGRLDRQQLFQEIVEASREMLDTQMSILLDLATNELRPIAWAGISLETATLMRSRYKEGLQGLVAWARQPARSADLRTDQRTALASKAAAAGMLSELAVPVLFFDKLYGVLGVQTNIHRHFTNEDTKLLMALAAHAGIALRNAQLFETYQETNHELEKSVAALTVSRQQAENARLAAVEANRLKTEFVNNMNHELRTPLNAVINFTRIVMDGHAGTVTETQVQYLGFVHDSGQHLLGLINDILDLAKIEAGKMELRRETTDLETIFRGVMSTGIGLTRDKGLRLRQEIAPDLPTITIDATRIRQVLLNLMSNAAKFTVQGEIVLHAERLGNQIIISVSDTGIGIAPEDMPKVFQEFRQIDGSLQRAETGTGLGMPISKRFIQLHGGDIWLESKLGVGTTVSFSLPISEAIAEP